MAAIGFFPPYGVDDDFAVVDGSWFGEPNGKKHRLELLTGNGRMIVRVKLEGDDRETDLLLTSEQAIEFGAGVQAALRRIGLDQQ